MDVDIGEWFGIANGINSFINNRVVALIDVNCDFPQHLRNKWMNFDKILYIH